MLYLPGIDNYNESAQHEAHQHDESQVISNRNFCALTDLLLTSQLHNMVSTSSNAM